MTRGCPGTTRWRFLAAALAAACLTGCGGSKGLVPVEGQVTFSGGNHPGAGYLFFVPREMSTNRKKDADGALPGTALFAADGSFRATTFTEGDGLRPGSYEVRIECAAAPTTPLDAKTHDLPAKALVPAAFQPLDLVVPPSGSRPVRYDLDVR
jgi:hypothetical protein